MFLKLASEKSITATCLQCSTIESAISVYAISDRNVRMYQGVKMKDSRGYFCNWSPRLHRVEHVVDIRCEEFPLNETNFDGTDIEVPWTQDDTHSAFQVQYIETSQKKCAV